MVRFSFTTKDGMEVIFREPERTDAILLVRFVNRIVHEPMSGLMINQRLGIKYERKWLKGLLKEISARREVTLLVEVDGSIAGSCSVTRKRYKEQHRAELGIALRKDIRGKGIGEALMTITIQLVRRRMKGIEQIDLKTFSYNKRALRLYEKLGFKKTGFVPQAAKEGKRYYGEHVMVLYLK